MKVEQRVTQEGANLILLLIEHPSGRVIARRVWEGASKYVQEQEGSYTLVIPKRAGLNIKPS